MRQYRIDYNMQSELKWSKISNQKINEYSAFIDYFFAMLNTNKLHFKSMIVDTYKLDYKKHHGNSKHKGFIRLYHTFLLNCFGKQYYSNIEFNEFVVQPDEIDEMHDVAILKRCLNSSMYKHGAMYSVFKSIDPTKSHNSELNQVADIILGAIGYHKNGYHLKQGACRAKVELSNKIANSIKVKQLGENTPKRDKFGMWNIKLKE